MMGFILAGQAHAQPSEADLPSDLFDVDLNRLLNFDLVVTLPGKKEQRLADSASAVSVLSNEDIKRSGVTHVAEALRLVPGVNVARVSSNKWAISIRGFNQVFANKLLVLVDGVSIFSPTTNGVYWESNELDLSDIDRIEVIRGPGAALWGSNAVNGVINIITKNSKDTQGVLAQAGGGTHERAFTKLRYGGKLSDETSYRVFGLGTHRAENRLSEGDSTANDDWDSYAGGFRLDSVIDSKDKLTVATDVGYQSDFFEPSPPSLDAPFVDRTSYVGDSEYHDLRSLVNWTHRVSADSHIESTSSYTRKERNTKVASFTYEIGTLGLQHRLKVGDRHDLIYGGDFRYFSNNTTDSPVQEVSPAHRQTGLASGFIQDEYSVVPDKLRIIFGSKFEYNESTMFEAMPNIRAVWSPSKELSFWGAVSRATAPPAVFFEDSSIPVAAFPVPNSPLSGVVTVVGNRQLESESLVAYETGVRSKVTETWFVDTSLFYNTYNNVFSAEPGVPYVGNSRLGQRPALILPFALDNALAADSAGGEIVSEWKFSKDWRTTFTYSYLKLDVDLGTSRDLGNKDLIENGSPVNQFSLRSSYDLSKDIQLDGQARYVDSVGFGGIPAYIELDIRAAWKATKDVELAVVGQNLLQSSHLEGEGNLFGPPPTEIERGVYAMVTVNF